MVYRNGNNLATSLLNYWKFDGDSVDTIAGNNGTDTNITYTLGKIGQAASFNGVSSKINLGSSITLSSGGGHSFSYWIIPRNDGPGPGNALGGILTGVADGLYNYSNLSLFQQNCPGLGGNAAAVCTTFGQWTHIVLTWGLDGVLQYYVNGKKDNSFVGQRGVLAMTMDVFGYVATYNGWLDTSLCEFGIWDRVLTQQDIHNLYNAGDGLTVDHFRNSQTRILASYDTSLQKDLVAYYKMDGDSTDTINGYDGTDTNITYSTANGKINQGAGYTTSSEISVPAFTELNATDKMSLQFWIKSPDLFFPIFVYQAFGIDVRYDGTYQYGVHIKIWNSSFTDYALVRNQTLTLAPNNTYFHVAITYDGTEPLDADKVKIYINGVQSAVVVTGFIPIPTTLNTNPNPILIGDNLTGAMDEVAFWKRVLIPAEVSKLYSGGTGIQFPFLRTVMNSNHYILDQFKNAKMAYSVRRLRTAYTGAALRVRRSSDNAEQDIYFDWKGDLDTASLMLFAGSDTVSVKIWYDQTGNGYDMSQTTNSLQPLIVNAGVLYTKNGRPSTFTVDGQNQYLHLSTNVTVGLNYSLVGVMEYTQNGREWLGASFGNTYGIYPLGTQCYHNVSESGVGTCYWLWNLGAFFPINERAVVRIHRTGINAGIKVNGNINIAPIPRTASDNNNFKLYSLHSEQVGNYSNMYLQETIIYDTDRTVDDDNIFKNIKQYY